MQVSADTPDLSSPSRTLRGLIAGIRGYPPIGQTGHLVPTAFVRSSSWLAGRQSRVSPRRRLPAFPCSECIPYFNLSPCCCESGGGAFSHQLFRCVRVVGEGEEEIKSMLSRHIGKGKQADGFVLESEKQKERLVAWCDCC